MEKQIEHAPRCGSIQSTQEPSKSKRPYNKISQETRSQILHALTIQKLPLLAVAEMFQTKPCTCKAILLTYEQEGRTEKKTSRRERVEIDSKIRILIVDPLTNQNFEYFTTKHNKMYTEEKDLNKKEESQLRKKLQQELLAQVEELQTGCYLVQQTLQQENSHDEIAPENIVRGVNMSIHLVLSKIKQQGISLGKHEQKKIKQFLKKKSSSQQLEELVKVEEGKSNQNPDVPINQEIIQILKQEELGSNYSKIKQFIDCVNLKSSQNPLIIERLNYLTNETILQMGLKQRLSDNDYYIAWLKQNISKQLKQFFQFF